jgi:hypothetical protein
MSAAATAAGYLYASGRLRGRGAREQEHGAEDHKPKAKAEERPRIKKPVRVAVVPEEPGAPERPRREAKAPKIEYRVRRWRPEAERNENE